MYRLFIKRFIDIVLSAGLLLMLLPVMLLVALLIRIKLGSPVIFAVERPGYHGRIFTLYKFRSMSNATDEQGKLLPDTERLTSFGRFLRSTSLDELPELWNILKGDMSLVGPRPLAKAYLPYYTEEESHRHDVLPGLTGLAQVNGRNDTTWEERFQYDLEYVEKYSFLFDVKIIIITIAKVFRRTGVCERGVDSLVDFDVYRQRTQGVLK